MMGNGLALSVVMPVGRGTQSIRGTLDSLLGQSLKNIEIICVAEETADPAAALVQDYAAKDPRVRLLTGREQEGTAGLTDIGALKGDYLLFLDPDETVTNYGVEAAYDKCLKNNLDALAFCTLYREGEYLFTDADDPLLSEDFARLLGVEEDCILQKLSRTPRRWLYRRSFVLVNGFNALPFGDGEMSYSRMFAREGRFMYSRDRVVVCGSSSRSGFESTKRPTRNIAHEASENPKVSVIVPIMNVEGYLNQALESLTGQTMEELEFILLNDGSTDHSLTIMKEYAEFDKRFVIVDKENTGYGHTMNMGIDLARGEYIGILESDDYAAPNMFERLSMEADKYHLDFVKSEYFEIRTGPDGKARRSVYQLSSKERYYGRTFCPGNEPESFLLQVNTWTGIYRRDFINKHHIRHHETPGASFQDNGFWFQTFCLGKRVRFIPDHLYQYRLDNPNASMLSRKKEKCVTEEFLWIHQWLETNPGLLRRFEGLLYVKQYRSMMLTLSRLEAERRLPYLFHMKDVLQKPYEEGRFDVRFLHPLDRDRLERIFADPEAYHNTIDISVVLIVNNSEEYLEQCLRSLLGISNVNIEVICMDNGSADRSSAILERIAETDCRVHVYRTEHQESINAQNEGIKHAAGTYLYFPEANDYSEPGMLDAAWNKAQIGKLDITVIPADFLLTDEKRFAGFDEFSKVPENKNREAAFVSSKQAWDKLFRTAYILERQARSEGYLSGDVMAFAQAVPDEATRVNVLDSAPLIHHRCTADEAQKKEEMLVFCSSVSEQRERTDNKIITGLDSPTAGKLNRISGKLKTGMRLLKEQGIQETLQYGKQKIEERSSKH